MTTQKITKLQTVGTEVAREFKEFSGYYDDYVLGNCPDKEFSYYAVERLATLFFSVAGLEPNQTALDVGTGTGLLAEALLEKVPSLQITGIDVSEDMLWKAVAKGCLSGFQTADANEPLPFESDSFDAVFSSSVFEFIKDDLSLVTEMARVVKPNGLLGLSAVQSKELTNLEVDGFIRLGYEESLGYEGINIDGQREEADYIYAVFKKDI